MLKLGSLLLFSENTEKLVEFYGKVFDMKPEWSENGYSGWNVGSLYFVIGPHDKVKGQNMHPERLLLNFETEDIDGDFARIEKLGAKVIAKPYNPGEDPSGKMSLATFADPDGNYFQIASPMKM